MTLVLKNFKAFEKALDASNFMRALNKHVAKATKDNAVFVERQIKKEIFFGNFEANKDITAAIKRSSRPLVDTHRLIKAIEHKPAKPRFRGRKIKAVVRINRRMRSKRPSKSRSSKPGIQMAKLAEILHWGTTKRRRITAKQAATAVKLYRKHGIDEQPAKGYIRIPGRPFMKNAVEKTETETKVFRNWNLAMLRAFRDTFKRAK